MTSPRPTRPLRIGPFRFDPALNELQRDGQVQRLPLRLADLLLRLAREPGQPVRRETLIDEVWERRQVNDEVLSRAIADLRQALGDDARTPRMIETLPKLGYRLLASVAEETSPAEEPSVPPAAAPVRTPGRRAAHRLAVAAALATFAWLGWLAWAPRGAWFEAPDAAPPAVDAERLLQARPFVGAPGRDLFPRFTPDGRFVVYTRAGPLGPPGAPAEVWLRAVDGTEERALVADALDNYCGSVAPDGGTLVWLRARPGVCEVMYRPLLGGPARVLGGCAAGTLPGCPEWTPDGRALLLGAGPDGEPGLRELGFPDGTARTLTVPPPGQRDLMPRVAPDGRSIVFWRGDAGARRLHRVARGGGAAQPLPGAPGLGFGHAFDRDGALLVADDRFGQRALLRLAKGEPARLLGAHDARHPDVARDGALVYEVARYDANLWEVALDAPGAVPRQLTHAPRYESQPAHSPDGAWLAFGSNRDGREGVYLVRADGRDERKLPLDPALRWTSPVWAPDGRFMLVLRYDAQGTRLCRHVLEGERTVCPEAWIGARHAAFFLAPDAIGVVDADGAAPRLWRLGLDEAPAQPVETDGAVDRCRANARWLVCHRPGRDGLWVRDRRDGTAREVLPELPAAAAAWTLVEDALYVPLAAAAPAGLYRLDLRDGTRRHVAALLPSAIGDALSVAPDQRRAVVARTDALEVDLMLVPPPQP